MCDQLVFVCEDQLLAAEGISHILQQDVKAATVEVFRNHEQLFQALKVKRPDVLILDVNLPEKNGIEILKQVRNSDTSIPVLMVTMHNDWQTAEQAKEFGANGFLLKDFSIFEFKEAFSAVQNGHYYESNRVKKKPPSSDAENQSLTTREIEIVRMIASCQSSNEIAEELSVSPHTVNTHRRNIYKKMGLSNMKELIRFAYDQDLV
ncbi:MAG: response regulator transcription factor [Balneolaceae bacterium]